MQARRLLLPLSLMLCLAGACDRGGSPVLRAADLVGCYELRDSGGQPLPSSSGFWSAPVRLDTVQSQRSQARSSEDVRWYVVQPTARIADSAAADTAFFGSLWRVVPPDTLMVVRSTAFFGVTVRLQRSGQRSMRGSLVESGDVSNPKHPPVAQPVTAQAVNCPNIEPPAV